MRIKRLIVHAERVLSREEFERLLERAEQLQKLRRQELLEKSRPVLKRPASAA
jgi:hypothetical protein